MELQWILFDGCEWWTVCDRFSVVPIPEGWVGCDHTAREFSEAFATPEEAKAWCAALAAGPIPDLVVGQ